jgi:hypothetical protein
VNSTRPAGLVLLMVLVGTGAPACDLRTHVVGRERSGDAAVDAIRIADAQEADARLAAPDTAGAGDSGASTCQMGGECSAPAGSRCLMSCTPGDMSITTCGCAEGHWAGCETELQLCSTEAACAPPRSCRTSDTIACTYCAANGQAVRCSCDEASQTWRCQALGVSCA